MNIELNYKELTLTETIERLKEILQTQQPYRYNDETIYNAINYLNAMTIMEEIKYADTVETISIPKDNSKWWNSLYKIVSTMIILADCVM